MSDEIRFENGVPIIDDANGEPRKLGTLVPPARVSAFAVFEDTIPVFTEDELIAIAKSGDADGRKKFDPSYIADQKSHGSCNGYAGARALTRARVRRGLAPVMLSGAYLYSLINGGSDNGSMLEDGMQAVVKNGVASEATVNWNQIYPNQYDRAKANAEAEKYKGWESYAVKTQAGLFTAAAKDFDLVVAVDVDNSFMQLNANGFPGSGRGMGNHAVGADGLTYSGGELALTAFNSWNTSYGADGRMLLSWAKHFTRTFTAHVFYAIRSTLDGGE